MLPLALMAFVAALAAPCAIVFLRRLARVTGQLAACEQRLAESQRDTEIERALRTELENAYEQQLRQGDDVRRCVIEVQREVGELKSRMRQARNDAIALHSLAERTGGLLRGGDRQDAPGAEKGASAAFEQLEQEIRHLATVSRPRPSLQAIERLSTRLSEALSRADALGEHNEGQAQQTMKLGSSARDSMRAAETGYRAVHETIESLELLRKAAAASDEHIRAVEPELSCIDEAVALIEDIARQTNLLAFNAAIIASQAGEHGRSFAVIATQVKALANRTAQSAYDVAGRLRLIRDHSEALLTTTSGSKGAVERGYRSATEAGDAMAALREAARTTFRRAQTVQRNWEQWSELGRRLANDVSYANSVCKTAVNELQTWAVSGDVAAPRPWREALAGCRAALRPAGATEPSAQIAMGELRKLAELARALAAALAGCER